MNEHHYFASSAFGWATADTRDEAIEKLVDDQRSEAKQITNNLQKNGEGAGMYVWTCKVHAGPDEDYDIEYYAPRGVKISDGQEHAIVYVSKTSIQHIRTYDREAEQRRNKMQNPVALLKHLESMMAEDTAPEMDVARTLVQEALELVQ